MTETMVEKVARAMKEKLDADGSVYFREDVDTCMVDGHVDMKALARAVIEAMREPTPAMYIAAEKIDFWVGGDDGDREEYVTSGLFERVWYATIDSIRYPVVYHRDGE